MEVCLRISVEVLPLTYVARVINKRRHKVTLIRKWGVEVCLPSAPLGIEPACRFEKRVYDHQDLQAVPDMSYYQGSYAPRYGRRCGRAGSHYILPNLGYGNFEEENLLFAVIYN